MFTILKLFRTFGKHYFYTNILLCTQPRRLLAFTAPEGLSTPRLIKWH